MKYFILIAGLMIGLQGCSSKPKMEKLIERKLQRTSFNPGKRPDSCMYRADWAAVSDRALKKTCSAFPKKDCTNGLSRAADDDYKMNLREEFKLKSAIDGNCKLYDYQIEQYLKQQAGVS